MPRVVENSDKLYPIHVWRKIHMKKSQNDYRYVLDGVTSDIEEVEIAGYMAYILKHRKDLQ
jgi:hypothetical protein